MYHRQFRFHSLLAFVIVTCSIMLGQCTLPPCTVTARKISDEERLRELRVDLTKNGLISALKNPDADIRSLAANMLARDRVDEAIPEIADAFTREQDSWTRINLANALARLGEEKGFTALNTSCNNADLPSGVRARAAFYLLELHRESCLNAVIDMLGSRRDDPSLPVVLSLVPKFKQASKEEFRQMLDLVFGALADPSPAVRLAAGTSLAETGDSSAIPYLQTAIDAERSKDIRSQLEADLQSLQKKATNPSPK